MREMVEVILYENGTYEVNDIDPHCATQRLYRYNGQAKLSAKVYNCPKDKWETYLMKLISTKDIDRKIKELQKQKKAIENLKENIVKTLKNNN